MVRQYPQTQLLRYARRYKGDLVSAQIGIFTLMKVLPEVLPARFAWCLALENSIEYLSLIAASVQEVGKSLTPMACSRLRNGR